MSSKVAIRLGFAFPNGIIIGPLLAPLFGYFIVLIFPELWKTNTIMDFLTFFLVMLGFFSVFLVCIMPLVSFRKVIIDTEQESIHYCNHILGLYKDRKPVSYNDFYQMKIRSNTRGKSLVREFRPSYKYTEKHNDILLYSESKKKKLLIKNVGNLDKAKKMVKQISAITHIPIIEK